MDPAPFNPHYRPDWWAWAVVIVSILFVVFFGLGLISAGNYLYRSMVDVQLARALSGNDFSQIEQYARDKFAGAPIIRQLINIAKPNRSSEADTLGAVLAILKDFDSAPPEVTHQRIAKLNSYSHGTRELSEVISAAELRAKKRAQQFLAQLEAENALQQARTAFHEAQQQYDDLSRETSELFTLPLVSETESIFYQSGILKGLPALKGLPDNIQDLEQLKSSLSNAGGAVKMQGANVFELFQEKLTTLRTSGEALENKIFAVDAALNEAESSWDAAKSKYERTSQGLQAQIRELIQKSS